MDTKTMDTAVAILSKVVFEKWDEKDDFFEEMLKQYKEAPEGWEKENCFTGLVFFTKGYLGM